MKSVALEASLLEKSVREAGFELFGVLPAVPSDTMPRYAEWVSSGMHGTMEWMQREDAVRKRAHPGEILPSVQSIIVFAYSYNPGPLPADALHDPSRGIIARYALYDDYHVVLQKKLEAMAGVLQVHAGVGFEWKAYVDTGPFLEREWAARAGLGFIGRNSNLINYKAGSYLFLCEMLVSCPLPTVRHRGIGSCGRCSNCSGACPTGAINGDRTIDARKCISYLTIENRGDIPGWTRPLMKNRIYGCDICQEVCPWNRKPVAVERPEFPVRRELIAPPLTDLCFFTDEAFRDYFKSSPIKRAKREGFMRNVSVAAGNWAASVRMIPHVPRNYCAIFYSMTHRRLCVVMLNGG